MCGVFGIVATGKSNIGNGDLRKIVDSLFVLSESRGKEASGLAVGTNGLLRVFKQPHPASTMIRSRAYHDYFDDVFQGRHDQPHSTTVIGHSRLVTSGTEEVHHNNQPVLKGGMVGIHNGIVVNDSTVWRNHPELTRELEVDTEIILGLVDHYRRQGSDLLPAVQSAFAELEGAASIGVLFEDLDQLLIATNNGSLYTCSSESLLIFASESHILKRFLEKNAKQLESTVGTITQVAPGSGLLVELDTLDQTHFHLYGTSPENVSYAVCAPKEIQDVSPTDGSESQNIPSAAEISTIPPSFSEFFTKSEDRVNHLERCSKCLLPETMPFVDFDQDGVCSYCRHYRRMEVVGEDQLKARCQKLCRNENGPDCIFALSGGRDSSYGLHYVKNVLGLTPLTYTYDWGMVTDLARRNISRMCGKLGVENILISADIRKKRANIKANVSAWLCKPDLGLVPLFMAGDKQFFYHANRLSRDYDAPLIIFSENPLEKTYFKTGFCGIRPATLDKRIYSLSPLSKLRLLGYYGKGFAQNPSYINQSLWDSFLAYTAYYIIPHNFTWLYHYIRWDEKQVSQTLLEQYDWELAPDTKTTWRIGDGTASFYNYIYYCGAGLTEHDTFRSNQIREGMLNRDEALALVQRDNQPRWESIKWYCDTIGIDFIEAIKAINRMPQHY